LSFPPAKDTRGGRQCGHRRRSVTVSRACPVLIPDFDGRAGSLVLDRCGRAVALVALTESAALLSESLKAWPRHPWPHPDGCVAAAS